MSDRIRGVGESDGLQRAEHDDVRLLDYLQILVRRRSVILSVTCLVLAAGTIFTLLSPPQYQAIATLQIERHIPEVLNFKSALSSDGAGSEEFFQTQYMILQSRTVLEATVDRVDLTNRPEYAGRTRSPLRRMIDRLTPENRSTSEQSPGRAELDRDAAVTYLNARLRIEPVRRSHLVRISVTDRSAELCRDLANALVASYEQLNLDIRYSNTAQASEFLSRQVAALQSEIANKERQLQLFGTTNDILTLRDETQSITSNALADLSARFVAAQGRLAAAQAKFDSVRELGPESLPEVLNSSLINGLKQQHAQLERRHSQMRERYRDDWPPLRELSKELDQARVRLDEETEAIATFVRSSAEADYERALAEQAYLKRQVERQLDEVRRVSRDEGEFVNLKAEIDNKRQFLGDLVNRQSESKVSDNLHNAAASTVRVVDPARLPSHPVRPRRVLNIALSLLLGLGLGIGAALLVDHLDYTVKHGQELEQLAGLPTIGMIPLYLPRRAGDDADEDGSAISENPADLASHADSRSAFAEAFKNLRTSLLLASAERPPRHVAVTSCEPRDGKSTVSLNLAIVLTQLGRRVLLVDADLRLPRVHDMLRMSNDVGLSHYLAGNARYDDLPRSSEIPGLDVITSGPPAPTPSELLDSPRLRSMLERLATDGHFDHVIFDCPPALQVADSVILASQVDATIVVVRREKTARDAVRETTGRLRRARANLIGTVLNGVKNRSGSYYGGYAESEGDEISPGPRSSRPWNRRRTGTG